MHVYESLDLLLQNAEGRRILLCSALLARTNHSWTPEQIMKTLRALCGISDAFNIDVDQLLAAISDLKIKE